MFQMNDDWLAQAVLANDVASIDRPHVVIVDDPLLGSIGIHGPFVTAAEACAEAELIADALNEGDDLAISPIITVIALTLPDRRSA